MLRIFAYLVWRSTRNRAAHQLQRVRRPRYAIAMLAGIGYFWLIGLRPGGDPGPLATTTGSPTGQLIYMGSMFALVASWWIITGDRPALVFSQAEVQFLFPAPVSRRWLIRYKLIQAQILILISTIIWVVLLRRGGPGALWMRGIAVWMLFTTLYLHRVGASLVRTSAAEHGVTGLRRNAIPLMVCILALAAVAWTVWRALPELRTIALLESGESAIERLMQRPAMAVVLFPFRLIAAPLFAPSAVQWWRAIWPAALVMAVHVPWVLHTDAAFEEAAAEAAAKRAQLLAAVRERRAGYALPGRRASRTWFPLAPTGHPATAIVWKNAIAFTRSMRRTTGLLLVAAFLTVFVVALIGPGGISGFSVTLALIFIGALTVLGPSFIRHDLRQDMLKLDLLRAYPVSAAWIVAAEIAGSTLVLTGLQLALIAVAGAMFAIAGALTAAPHPWLVPALLATALTLPTLNAIRMTVANAAALLFPGWVRLGSDRSSGVEAMGQNVLTVFASLFMTAVLLVPPFLFGVLAAYALGIESLWAVVPAAVAGALAAYVELWVVVRRLGRTLSRTDPLSAEPTG